jgi:stage II sporulation protein D
MDLILSKNEKKRVNGPLHVTSLGGFIRVGSSQYRDDLYVYSFNSECIVVNHVDLEKYVAGLLNSEMSAAWSLSTLKAQAVAARTYAIYQMRESSSTHYRKLKAPFDLDSSVKDQVYEGAHQERYKALLAVQQTRGQVLTYAGKPIKAFYHSTCGGRTESPEKVWGLRLPYMRSVKCDYCQGSPRYNWSYSLNTQDVERKLQSERLLQGRLISMMVLNRNLVGRADKVEVRGTLGTMIVSAPRIREVIGNLHLRSTDFSVINDGGKFTFVGHGSGHAVGMCQWGAKTMGERGRSYAEILKYYYPAAQLSKLY